MAKYIYKKKKCMPIQKSVIKYGDVVDVSFYLNPVIEKVYKCGSSTLTNNSVTKTKLAKDFVLYDDIEDVCVKQAILIIANMVETSYANEKDIIRMIHQYCDKRTKRLKEIELENAIQKKDKEAKNNAMD